MLAVLQRVSEARVIVDGETIGEIGPGLLALVCAERGDTPAEAQALPLAPSQNTAYAAWFALHELFGQLAYRWSR